MHKNLVLIGVAVVVLVGGFLLTTKKDTNMAVNNGVYCGSDGFFTDTKSIQSHRSYCLKINTTQFKINIPTSLTFSIIDDEGTIVKDFQIEQEKILHLIVVRKDLNEFQHLHPKLDSTTGIFTLDDFTLTVPGPYIVYGDFVPKSAQTGLFGEHLKVVVSTDIVAEGSYKALPVVVSDTITDVDRYKISFTTEPKQLISGINMLSFSIKKDGKAVTTLKSYLGSLGHSVVIKENTLEYIHAHALQKQDMKQTGTIDFHVEFPSAGKYKVFMQFQTAEEVEIASFVVEVNGGQMTSPDMDHSQHMVQ